jgi:hypothetical protein
MPTYVSGDPIASSGFRRTIAPIMKRYVGIDPDPTSVVAQRLCR